MLVQSDFTSHPSEFLRRGAIFCCSTRGKTQLPAAQQLAVRALIAATLTHLLNTQASLHITAKQCASNYA